MEADEKKCPQCAEIVKAEARICRFCGHYFANDALPEQDSTQSPSPGSGWTKGCLVVLGIFLAIAIIGSLLPPNKQSASSTDILADGSANVTTGVESSSASVGQADPSEEEQDNASSVGLFGPQANAARNAQQYLEMTGFSRQGLIEQLSSDAGNGYSVADATAAVDSLDVDWNEQAVRSAKQYLDMTGFSCSGLIEQLSSDAGSDYTEAQARYGAAQAGAC